MHFSKKAGQDQDVAMNEMLTSLADLKLTVQKDDEARDVPLKVELIKRGETPQSQESRIETTDVTSV